MVPHAPHSETVLTVPKLSSNLGLSREDPSELGLTNCYAVVSRREDLSLLEALEKASTLIVVAHQDDVEILAAPQILLARRDSENPIIAVVMTDGGGSPRTGKFADFSNEQMGETRVLEQEEAASIGKYGLTIQTRFTSAEVKNPAGTGPKNDLLQIMNRMPNLECVITHNLFDRHETHIGVAMRVVEAIRSMPDSNKPKTLLGGEVWGTIDQLPPHILVSCPIPDNDDEREIATKLIAAHVSQVEGGKNYTDAIIGRRVHGATMYAHHGVDDASQVSFFADMTRLINERVKVGAWVSEILAQVSVGKITSISSIEAK